MSRAALVSPGAPPFAANDDQLLLPGSRADEFALQHAQPPPSFVVIADSIGMTPTLARVLSIQSHVVHGYVGNKAAVLPLQVLGVEVDAINSVQFSCHTGYSLFTGDVLQGDALWELVRGLEGNSLLGYTHLLTGYIGSASVLRTVLRTLTAIRRVSPAAVYLCDPVLGDAGKLYVPSELVEIYKTEVVPLATMLTPNQFEAELLTGMSIATEADGFAACEQLHSQGVHTVVITSMQLDDADAASSVITLLASRRRATAADGTAVPTRFRIDIPKIPSSFTGTGDLTAALLLAWTHRLGEEGLQQALENTVASVQAVLKRTVEEGDANKELRLVQSIHDIIQPSVKLVARAVAMTD